MQKLNNRSKQIGCNTLFLWVFASAIGMLIGVPMGASGSGENLPTIVLFGIIGGIAVGVMQWLALRHLINQAGWWILASVIGWAAGWTILNVLKDIFDLPSDEWAISISFAGAGAILGIVVGTAQWLVLRRQVAKAGWWIPAWGLSGLAGSFIGVHLGYALSKDPDSMVNAIIAWFTFAAVLTVISGTTTGVVLIWLLRQHTPEIPQTNS